MLLFFFGWGKNDCDAIRDGYNFGYGISGGKQKTSHLVSCISKLLALALLIFQVKACIFFCDEDVQKEPEPATGNVVVTFLKKKVKELQL